MRRQFHRYIKPDYEKQKSRLVPVYIRYDYSRTRRTLITTNHRINPDLHWDFKNNTIKRSCPNFNNVILDIENIENKVSNIVLYARNNHIDPTPEYVIEQLQAFTEILVDNNVQTDLFRSLDNFIIDRETNANVSVQAVYGYKALRKHLINFEKYWKREITFSSLNVVFYEKFIFYLTYVAVKPDKEIGLKLNTISKQI